MNHNITTKDVFSLLEQWAPQSLAYDWDPVGLQIGSHNHQVTKVMVTLDVDMRVIEEAIDKGANVIIAHHPLLFNPLTSVDTDSSIGKAVTTLIRHNITVYAAHTNLDIAEGGVNDILAEKLGLQNTEILLPTEKEDLFKIVVFVPKDFSEHVRRAIGEAGAGWIGNYRDCSFMVEGEGSFKPLDASDPFIGEKNSLTTVQEVRIETIVEEHKRTKVIQAIKDSHPYEEVAYDIYPTENEGKQYGLGRIGKWTGKSNASTIIDKVKESFDLTHVRFVGDIDKKVKKVAVVGGSGEKFIAAAKAKGADMYITGDITYHAAQEAEKMGLCVIDAGHYIEHVMKEATVAYLNTHLSASGIECIASSVHTDPFSYR